MTRICKTGNEKICLMGHLNKLDIFQHRVGGSVLPKIGKLQLFLNPSLNLFFFFLEGVPKWTETLVWGIDKYMGKPLKQFLFIDILVFSSMLKGILIEEKSNFSHLCEVCSKCSLLRATFHQRLFRFLQELNKSNRMKYRWKSLDANNSIEFCLPFIIQIKSRYSWFSSLNKCLNFYSVVKESCYTIGITGIQLYFECRL